MDFKSIYDPRHVYEGFFETYFIRPFFHHYADFRGRETGWSCALSLLAWLIITLGLAGIMLGLVGLLGPEVGFTALTVGGVLWGLFSVVPLASLIGRATGGQAGDRRDGTRHPLLGIDILLGAICVLFFIFGLLMMTTTLHSENLTADPGTFEEDTTAVELEEVKEEPIFTYQDAAPEAPVEDTLGDLEDPEAIDPDESFDPTITTVPEEMPELTDSI